MCFQTLCLFYTKTEFRFTLPYNIGFPPLNLNRYNLYAPQPSQQSHYIHTHTYDTTTISR